MAAGIAGFIDGVFKGMDWREGRDDRARRRKMEDEEFGWAREDQEWQREDRSYTRSERKRLTEERDAERAAWEETADDMLGGTADARPATTDPRDVLITQGGLGFGLPGAQPTQPQTQPSVAAPAAQQQGLGRTGAGLEGGARAERPPMSVASAAAAQAPAQRMVGPVAGRPERVGTLPAAQSDAEPRGMSILEAAAEQNMPSAARKRFNRSEAPAGPQAVPLAGMMPNNPMSSGGGVADGPMTPPRAEDASLPKPSRTAPKVSPDAPVTESGTPMGSVDAMAQSSRKLSFGIAGQGGVTKPTATQINRVVDTSAKAFTSEKVPAIVEHYIRTGQIEKAQAFEKWVEDRGVQKGMRSWMKAIHSFQVGDGDGFLDSMADAYEADNYYDDGLSIVREESSLTRDDRGNIVGARITFKEEATGRTFTQNVTDVRDLVASAIGVMAPEKAFELAWDQTFGKDKAADPKERAIDLKEVEGIVEKRNFDPAYSSDPAWANLSPDQKRQQVAQEMAAAKLGIVGGGGAASGVGGQIPLYR